MGSVSRWHPPRGGGLSKMSPDPYHPLNQISFIGDDLNDTEVLKQVGFSSTPADGVIENKKIVDYICTKEGGKGCVRELADLILKNQAHPSLK